MQNRFYLKEFQFYDGEAFVTFNIVDINTERMEITVAVTDRGRISLMTYELKSDCQGLYFEYGSLYEKIELNSFDNVQNDSSEYPF